MKKFTSQHLVSFGDSLIENVKYLSLDEIKKLYINMRNKGISELVFQREYPFIEKLIYKFKDKSLK